MLSFSILWLQVSAIMAACFLIAWYHALTHQQQCRRPFEIVVHVVCMGFHDVHTVLNSSGPRNSTRLVLVVLAHLTDDKSHQCHPKVTTLMKLTALSRTAVLDALAALKRLGVLIVVDPTAGKRNRYVLNVAALACLADDPASRQEGFENNPISVPDRSEIRAIGAQISDSLRPKFGPHSQRSQIQESDKWQLDSATEGAKEVCEGNTGSVRSSDDPEVELLVTRLESLTGQPETTNLRKVQVAERLVRDLHAAGTPLSEVLSALEWAFLKDPSGFWPRRIFSIANLAKNLNTILAQYRREARRSRAGAHKAAKAESLQGGYVSDKPSL